MPGERGLLHLGARHHDGRAARARRHRVGFAVVQEGGRLTLPEDRGDLVRAEPGVDAGGDRAEAGRGRVTHGEVDGRREEQRDHVAAAHPAVGEGRGERVGAPHPLGEADARVALDVRGRVGEGVAHLAEQRVERRAPELRLLGQRFSTSMPLWSASHVFGPAPSSRNWAFRIFFISLRGSSLRISM